MQITLDYEVIDQVLAKSLMDHYLMVKKEIKDLKKELEKTGTLPSYKLEDLDNNKALKKALSKVIEYYVGFHWKERVAEYKAELKAAK